MEICSKIEAVRQHVREWKKAGLTIGFVPTMGYLHEGHKSLIDAARQDNDRVVVSIFVNPMQFGPNEDLASYPRDLKKDAGLCEAAGVDLIFNPQPEEMYAPDFASYVDMDGLTAQLCGKSRLVHFRGVQTVVLKLFHIVTPDRAYFGQKDAQQLAVVKRMVRDLNVDIEIIGCPIVREEDGLAKSSRNTYLNEAERKAAEEKREKAEREQGFLDSIQRMINARDEASEMISKTNAMLQRDEERRKAHEEKMEWYRRQERKE